MTAASRAESTSLATTDRALPDLSKPANLIKFAGFWDSKRLDSLTKEQQAYALAALGNHIGVHAELGEILLYQGKPYITIDGRIRIAHETGLLDGIQARPATRMEWQNYGCDDGDMLWVCYVFKKGARRAFVGWGHVAKGDRNPVSKTHPRELAKKRAKYDALRAAFPPKERITELHEKYIEEAEEVARARTDIATATYDGTELLPDDIGVIGEELAASALAQPDPYTGEPVIPQKPDIVTAPEARPARGQGRPHRAAAPLDEDDELVLRDDDELPLDDQRPSGRRNDAVRDGGL
jgi:hypothetical protein